MDDKPINTPPRSSLHIKPWFRFGMGIFTLNVSCFTLWFIHAQSLECLICSVLKKWPTDIFPKILMVKPGSIFVSDMAMLLMTFLPGLHFVRGGEKFPRVQLLLPLLLLVAQMCVLMFLEAWGVDVKYRDSEMCSHTHKSHVKFLMVYFTIRVFSVCLLFLKTEFNKKL